MTYRYPNSSPMLLAEWRRSFHTKGAERLRELSPLIPVGYRDGAHPVWIHKQGALKRAYKGKIVYYITSAET